MKIRENFFPNFHWSKNQKFFLYFSKKTLPLFFSVAYKYCHHATSVGGNINTPTLGVTTGMFRLATKNIFLTYPRCTIEKNVLLDHLITLLSAYTPHIRVARELHEDGHPHLHVFIRLERKLESRNERYFDHANHHPNIVSRIKDLQATFQYVSKDNDFIDHGQPEPPVKKKWQDVTSASTEEEFWTTVQDVSPRDFVLSRDRLLSFASWKFGEKNTSYVSAFQSESFNVPPALNTWKDQAFNFEVSRAASRHLTNPPRPTASRGAFASRKAMAACGIRHFYKDLARVLLSFGYLIYGIRQAPDPNPLSLSDLQDLEKLLGLAL